MVSLLYITQVRDNTNIPSFIIYEQGEFNKPIMVLTQIQLFHLRDQINESIGTFFHPYHKKEMKK